MHKRFGSRCRGNHGRDGSKQALCLGFTQKSVKLLHQCLCKCRQNTTALRINVQKSARGLLCPLFTPHYNTATTLIYVTSMLQVSFLFRKRNARPGFPSSGPSDVVTKPAASRRGSSSSSNAASRCCRLGSSEPRPQRST